MTYKTPSQRRREDALLLSILGLVIALVLFIKGGSVIRLFLLAVIGVIVFAYLAFKIINIVTATEKGTSFAYWWNEIVYSIFGI
ncbi:MAG: hypothetical protein ACTSQE_05845, partial [Candidatus Heimdallarchaeaceae archaeon]